MHKAELRKEFLAKRKALTPTEVTQRSELITQRFFDFLEKKVLAETLRTIHCFLPIQRQNEVNTWPIIHGLWEKYTHLGVTVSVTSGLGHPLRHYRLFPQTQLVENRWGIPEPVTDDAQLVHPSNFDLILVPLLAFDQQGQRIGYGGGFYDRFLAECRPDCQKIGLSLFNPIERIESIMSTDIALDACITPEQLYSFK